MESLAEFLGVADPRKPDAPRSSPARKHIRDFCRDILASDEYRASLLRRIFIDELPPAVEALLYHYAHGKPVEKVEIKDTTNPLEKLTLEQLEQRALFLAELAKSLREQDVVSQDDAPQDDVPSVH